MRTTTIWMTTKTRMIGNTRHNTFIFYMVLFVLPSKTKKLTGTSVKLKYQFENNAGQATRPALLICKLHEVKIRR